VGDCVFLEAGTVHALGAGLMIAEIQQSSNTTYRLFDWNRVDPSTGEPRQLQVEQALECIDFGDVAPKLIEPIANGEVDVAFGSRALDRSLIGIHQPWRREQAGRIFNLLVRFATGLPFWDTQCGFKAFRLDIRRPILEAARVQGFAFDVELLYLAQCAGLRIREIPVRWNHAEGSKVSFFRDSLRMLREVIALRKQVEAIDLNRPRAVR